MTWKHFWCSWYFFIHVVDESGSRLSFKVYKFSTLIHLHTDPQVHYHKFLIPYSNKSKDRTNGDVVAGPLLLTCGTLVLANLCGGCQLFLLRRMTSSINLWHHEVLWMGWTLFISRRCMLSGQHRLVCWQIGDHLSRRPWDDLRLVVVWFPGLTSTTEQTVGVTWGSSVLHRSVDGSYREFRDLECVFSSCDSESTCQYIHSSKKPINTMLVMLS